MITIDNNAFLCRSCIESVISLPSCSGVASLDRLLKLWGRSSNPSRSRRSAARTISPGCSLEPRHQRKKAHHSLSHLFGIHYGDHVNTLSCCHYRLIVTNVFCSYLILLSRQGKVVRLVAHRTTCPVDSSSPNKFFPAPCQMVHHSFS